jgi:hypothetical protein
VVALVAGWAAGLSWPNRLVAPIALVLAGSFGSAQRWNERRKRRAVADAWLRGGGRTLRFGWRAEELTSPRERKLLARSLRGVVRELGSPPMRRSTIPLNRRALRRHAAELDALADLLDELERSVSPAGILDVQQLLTSPGSPLYMHSVADDLPERLVEIRRKLEAS